MDRLRSTGGPDRVPGRSVVDRAAVCHYRADRAVRPIRILRPAEEHRVTHTLTEDTNIDPGFF